MSGYILRKNFRKKKRGLPFRFSLFSKIALLAFIVLFIGGTIFDLLIRKRSPILTMNESGRWVSSMFYSMTTRNAGLQINDLGTSNYNVDYFLCVNVYWL